jgi:FkbM family methyltransferase
LSRISPAIPWRDRLFAAWRRRGWRGFHRAWGATQRADQTMRVRTKYGSVFALDPFAYIDGIVIQDGFYESEVLEMLRPSLQAGAVLWDIGANFGLHAVTAARLAPETTVVAFEPNPAEHARLLLHRAWNAPHLITSSIALSDAAGVLPLHLGPKGNSGMTSLTPWFENTYAGTVLVAVATGDEFVARGSLPAPTAIKLDVEGHEAAVLRGLAVTLATPACAIVLFEDEVKSDSPAKEILQRLGFVIEPLRRHEHSDHALANFIARKPRAAPV